MLPRDTKLHFMGIGGIGQSALAKIFRQKGHHVSGCDQNTQTPICEQLRELGCTIEDGHDSKHMQNVNVLVVSSAIDKEHPEIAAAHAQRIPIISRATLLSELSKKYFTVGVTGSHGKTTTVAMIAHILHETKNDPTVIAGGIIESLGSNARLGKNALMVCEADESDRSHVNLHPTIGLVTNVDTEHLDVYNDVHDVFKSYQEFLGRIPFYGTPIVCADDPHLGQIKNALSYGLSENAHIRAKIVELGSVSSIILIYRGKAAPGEMTIPVPGKHNVLNALGAITVCLRLGLAFNDIADALASYAGTKRRFEFVGKSNGAEVFDDYGHHPTEIAATLEVARKRAQQKLVVVFQPQRYSRTKHLWDDFVTTLASAPADELILTDIYPAGEEPLDGIDSQTLIAKIKEANPALNVSYLPAGDTLAQDVQSRFTSGDLVLTLGAGKLDALAKELVS